MEPQRRTINLPADWYRLMVDGAGDYAIFSLDPESTVITWNVGAERMFGYSSGEAVGQPGSFIFTPEDRLSGNDRHEVAIAALEGRAQDDRWHVRHDGSRFWASGLLMAIRSSDQVILGFVKIIQDRTPERRLEESLRQSEEQLARVLLGNPAAIAVELADTQALVLANESFLSLIGYWRTEVMGKSGVELSLWTQPEERASLLARRNNGQPMSAGVDLRRKDGSIRRCIASFARSTVDNRECVIGTYIDVTELESS